MWNWRTKLTSDISPRREWRGRIQGRLKGLLWTSGSRGHGTSNTGVAHTDSQGVVSMVWVEVKCKSQDLELKLPPWGWCHRFHSSMTVVQHICREGKELPKETYFSCTTSPSLGLLRILLREEAGLILKYHVQRAGVPCSNSLTAPV